MDRIYDGDLEVREGLVNQPGIQEHRRGQVLERTSTHIAVKWPGGKLYQRSTGQSPSYPPTAMVYKILETRHPRRHPEGENLTVRHILHWDVGRKRREKEE